MRTRRSLIGAFIAMVLLSIAGPISLAALTTQLFANQEVAVTRETLQAGESDRIAANHPAVFVYLEGQSAEITFAGGSKRHEKIARGKAVREPAEAATIANTGPIPLIFVRVVFLTPGSDETWGMTGLAPNYKILFEDRHSRTYDIRIPAHGREPRHTHRDRVVICLSGAQLEHVLPDGRVQPSTLKTDDVVWRPGQTHVGHNLGDTDLWVIAIEPK